MSAGQIADPHATSAEVRQCFFDVALDCRSRRRGERADEPIDNRLPVPSLAPDPLERSDCERREFRIVSQSSIGSIASDPCATTRSRCSIRMARSAVRISRSS